MDLTCGCESGNSCYCDEDGLKEWMLVGDHKIQLGGNDGDGFCYTHQSFKCLENLTDEERDEMAQKAFLTSRQGGKTI